MVRVVVIVFFAQWLLFTGRALAIDPNIKQAADQINSITPLAVPQQTIKIGKFDCSTRQMQWLLTETFEEVITTAISPSPSIPPGTTSPPPISGRIRGYVAYLNSYNMKYEIEILNKPDTFGLSLMVPDFSAPLVQKAADYDSTSHVASVEFNPNVVGIQQIRINTAGVKLLFYIKIHLQEQLGAFVIPYLLTSIVYEPPGGKSQASYEASSTVGTVASTSVARTTGLAVTVDAQGARDSFIQVARVATSIAGKVVGVDGVDTAFEIVDAVIPHEARIKERDDTTAKSESKGIFFSIAQKYGTDPTDEHPYPGQGDVFVVMTDVLFMYLVKNDKVYVAPVAYKYARTWVASELPTKMPPELAQKYINLNPHFNSRIRVGMVPSLDFRVVTPGGSAGPVRVSPRFRYTGHIACDVGGFHEQSFKISEYNSTTVTSETAETSIYRFSWLLTSLTTDADSTDTIQKLVFSSSTQQVTEDAITTSVKVQSNADEGPFEVLLYYDSVFRTYLPMKGEALDTEPNVSGLVVNDLGRPVAKQQVVLTIGSQRFFALSDANGKFAFRFKKIPKAAGELVAGKGKISINYFGNPLRDLRIRIPQG